MLYISDKGLVRRYLDRFEMLSGKFIYTALENVRENVRKMYLIWRVGKHCYGGVFTHGGACS